MPGVLCRDESPPPPPFRPSTALGVNYSSYYFADYESGIEDSGESDADSTAHFNGGGTPRGTPDDRSNYLFQAHASDPAAAPAPTMLPPNEGSGAHRAAPSPSMRIGGGHSDSSGSRDHWTARRSSLQCQASSTGPDDPISPFLPHSAPASTGDCYHSVPVALHSALTTCALPTICVSQDVSQTESNQEDGGGLPPKCLIDRIKEEPKCNRKRSTSRNSSPLAYPLPHSGGLAASQDPINIPTDLSDSNGSDNEKEKLSGPTAETVVCPNIVSHHQGREAMNSVYALPIDTIFTLLFTNSKFMLDLHKERKTYDVVASSWQSNPETNQKIRQVTYTVTLPTNSFGPKVSHVTETQVISSFSKSCEIYTIDAEACNGGIPYADYFYISNHWCLTRESSNETRLAVWTEVKYKKNVWGFMKSVIDKNAYSGIKSLMNDLNDALQLEVDRANLKRTRRRRRRCGSKSSDLVDPLLQLPQGDKAKDISSAAQIPFRKLTLPSIFLEPESPPLRSAVRTVALVFLCVLLAVNAFLYYRLYALEDRVVNGVSAKHFNFGPALFKRNDDAPVEEWVQILHEQEELHSAEVDRWRKAVSDAADYLRKAEESLRSLHASIPHKQASKMESLLRHLQFLQQMQDRLPPSTTFPPSDYENSRSDSEL